MTRTGYRQTITEDEIELAVCGAHLSGQPLNRELIDLRARLVRRARTTRGYRFYALKQGAIPKPGLVFDGKGQGGIELEIWSLSPASFAAFVAAIPPPLAIGTIALEGGDSVKGFLCEAYAVIDAEDITAYGGWRAYRALNE
jgi:allophanate hydrolase